MYYNTMSEDTEGHITSVYLNFVNRVSHGYTIIRGILSVTDICV